MNRVVSPNVAVGTAFPDVCVVHAVTIQLLRRGMSALGTRQLLGGDMVTGLGDRNRVVNLIHAEKNQDIDMERRRTKNGNRTETVDNNETLAIHQNRSAAVPAGWGDQPELQIFSSLLRRAGMSTLGIMQCLSLMPVADAIDRQRLAAVVITLLDGRR